MRRTRAFPLSTRLLLALGMIFAAGGACECDESLSDLPTPAAVLVHGSEESPPLPRLDVPLGARNVGETTTITLALRNDGDAALEVSGLRLISDPALCPIASGAFRLGALPGASRTSDGMLRVAAQAEQAIPVEFRPTSGAPACALLEVENRNDERQPRLLALLSGQGDAAQLCTDEPLIDFGEVWVGERSERRAQLTSCGTRPITVQAMSLNDFFPPFEATLPSLPIALRPGEVLSFPVAFAPTEERTHSLAANSAGLISLSTDAAGQSYQVALVGASRRAPSCELIAVPNVLNFGSVAAGRSATQPLALRNIGELPCDIDDALIRAPAGSFSLTNTQPAAGASLAQGEVLSVEVTFAPAAALGVENGFLDVTSNDPVTPTLSVALEGNSIEPTPCMLEASPTGLNFGFQAMGRSVERAVTLTNVGTERCSVRRTVLTSGAPHFSVLSNVFPFIGSPVGVGDSFVAYVAYRPEGEGAHSGLMQVTFRESGFNNSDQTLTIPLSGEGLAPCLRVTPLDIDFGNVAAGQSQTRPLRLENCGAVDVRLRGVQLRAASHPGFSLASLPAMPLFLAPGAGADVSVRAAPTQAHLADAGNAMYGTVDVLSDDPSVGSHAVALRANAPQCTEGLVCAPRTLDFGEVIVGEGLVRALTCTNVGTSTVSLSPSLTAPFQVVNAPPALAPGQTGVVTVRYRPDAARADASTLRLGANDCGGIPIEVALQGEGVDDVLPACPTPQAFTPEVVWHWEGGTTSPNSKQVWVTPLVSRLEDTDADGRVTRADMPRVVFISFDHRDSPNVLSVNPDNFSRVNDPTPGMLRALDGATGAEVFSVVNPDHRLNSSVTPVLADIDADGYVEIVAQKYVLLEGVEDELGTSIKGKFRRGFLIAFEHDGTFKWESEEWTRSEDEIEDAAALSVGDVDGDGFAELAVGDHLFDHMGNLRFRGGQGTGSTGHGPASVLADVDGAPGLELVAGRSVYRADGTLLWHRSDLDDGHPAVADLDGDGNVEVVLMNGRLWVLDGRSGQTLAGPRHPPTRLAMGAECSGGNANNAGEGEEDPCSVIPTQVALADMNGDGALEIAVARQEVLLVYDRNLNELWRTQIWDGTGASGPLAFDFEGDGSQNVVYSDEGAVWVYDSVGDAIYEAERSSVTMMETPAVADIDNDGHANLVIGSNEPQFGLADGLDALSNAGTSWVHARGIWNQHGYLESLIGELGTPIYDPAAGPGAGFRTASARCE